MQNNVKFSKANIIKFTEFMGFTSPADLYYKVYIDEIPLERITAFSLLNAEDNSYGNSANQALNIVGKNSSDNLKVKPAAGYDLDDLNFTVATCCHPLPGDEVVAYTNDGISRVVHRTNCHEAIELMARFSKRTIHARWSNKPMGLYLGGLKISGFDRKNMISDIVRVISEEMRFNIRSFHIDTSGELFEAYISFYVMDTIDLNRSIEQINQIDGISSASRMLKFVKT
jgi:GTP pyrophosphokinase